MSKKYSIILPVRNGGAYVKQCVHSILQQSLQDFNLLVLDNASTDGTLDWIQSLKDERIICFPSEVSLSMTENWNRICTLPKNEFMTIIGHDDLLLPDYLKTMDQLIRENPDAGLYQAHFDFINAKGEFVHHCQPMAARQTAGEFITAQIRQTLDSMGTGYMMCSKDYDRLGGIPPHYPNLIFADYELWTRLTAISYKATTPDTCFQYRLHDSVSRLTTGEDDQNAFIKYIQFLTTFQQSQPGIAQAVKTDGKRFLLYYCESLSHRLLKSPLSSRNTRVQEFVETCKSLAKTFIPGQTFEPEKVFRIKLAIMLDNSRPGRFVFQLAKKYKMI